MKERIAKALYEHWIAEDFANDYAPWDKLQDKATWIARAEVVLAAMHEPTPQMLNAGLAWQAHCSDLDSLFSEMISAARYPESYPAEMPALYAA